MDNQEFIIGLMTRARPFLYEPMYTRLERDILEDFPYRSEIAKRKEDVDKIKYYGGFRVGKETELYKEELDKFELALNKEIEESKSSLDYITPYLISYMRDFDKYHETIRNAKDQLDLLKYKRNNRDEDDDE